MDGSAPLVQAYMSTHAAEWGTQRARGTVDRPGTNPNWPNPDMSLYAWANVRPSFGCVDACSYPRQSLPALRRLRHGKGPPQVYFLLFLLCRSSLKAAQNYCALRLMAETRTELLTKLGCREQNIDSDRITLIQSPAVIQPSLCSCNTSVSPEL